MNKVDELLKNILRAIKSSTTQTALKPLAKGLADQIRKRTRLGKGVDSSGNLESIAGLQESTIKARSRNRARLFGQTTPSRSHLTATGQLLDSIEGKSETNRIIIGLKDARRGELNGSASKIGNKELEKFVRKGGRNFLQLANFEKSDLEKALQKIILQKLSKL